MDDRVGGRDFSGHVGEVTRGNEEFKSGVKKRNMEEEMDEFVKRIAMAEYVAQSKRREEHRDIRVEGGTCRWTIFFTEHAV